MAGGDGIQTMQQFIPVRTPTPNDRLSEGMLTWSLVLPPVSNILTAAALTKKSIHPVRVSSTPPFAEGRSGVGMSALLPKDFQYSAVNAQPAPNGGSTTGQTGNPSTTGGTSASAPLPVVTNDVPVSYAIYTFKPTVTQSVATVTQLGSITMSLSYYLPDWTFAIWIPSIQRYIEYVPSAINDVPKKWVTINAATNIQASGSASIEFIFGLRQAQATDLTAPYGSIAVNNYQIAEHMFIAGLGGGDGGVVVYPGAGFAVSTGTGWDTSIAVSDVAMMSDLPQIIQVADEATAIAQSQINTQNFYFWVTSGPT